jgi:hypothetical protein
MEAVKKAVTHNFSHRLFVLGASSAQYMSAISVGLLLLLIALYIFDSYESNFMRMVVGLPVLVIGATIVLLSAYGLFAVLFSHRYSHTRCPFCGNPIQMVDSEVKIVCGKCKKEIESSKKS